MTSSKKEPSYNFGTIEKINALEMMVMTVHDVFPSAFSAAMLVKLNVAYYEIMLDTPEEHARLRLKDLFPTREEVRIARRIIFLLNFSKI